MGPASYDSGFAAAGPATWPPSLAEIRAHRLFLLEERRLRGT